MTTTGRPLRRLAVAASVLAVVAVGCSSSVAGLYQSQDGTKLLELSEDGRFAMDFGHAAAELGAGPELLTGRYEVTDGTIRLRYQGKVVIELRRDGDHLVMRDGTVLEPADAVPHALPF